MARRAHRRTSSRFKEPHREKSIAFPAGDSPGPAAPRFAASSALLAIVLGLVNQATNLGNLTGPAVMAFIVQHFGWARAPLLFVGVTIAGVTISLLLRQAMKHARTTP